MQLHSCPRAQSCNISGVSRDLGLDENNMHIVRFSILFLNNATTLYRIGIIKTTHRRRISHGSNQNHCRIAPVLADVVNLA